MLSKKVLGTVLTAAMIATALAPVAMADTGFTDVKDTDTFASAVKDLNALGVMQGDATGGTFRPTDKFTRAEAAKVLVVATGYGKLTGSSKNTFTDVNTTDWFNGVVNVANQVGLVQGYTKDNKKVFNPSGNVTYGEFATMAVRALGYQDDDLSGSTWPYNYIAKATELGLFDDLDSVDATAPATRADIAVITDKLLSTPTVAEASKPDSYDADGKLVSKGTLLTSVIGKLGLASVTGTVYATNNEDSSVAAGKVQIWNDSTKALETYDVGSSTIKEDLGKKVSVYVSKKGALASITSVDSTVSTVSGTLSSGKLNGDTVPLTGISTVYFNGVKKGSAFTIPDGSTVTYRYTTDTAGTKKYDTAVAYATKADSGTYVVASVDAAKNTITVYGDLSGSTSTKTVNVISAATVTGDATKLADIKQYDVIQVTADVSDAAGTDTMTKEAIKVVRKTVAGKLASKSADGATVTIGSTSYTANDSKLIPSDAFDTAYTYVLGVDGKVDRVYNATGTTTSSTFDASKYAVYQGVYNVVNGLTKTSYYQFKNALGNTVVYPGPSASLNTDGTIQGTNPLPYTSISKSSVTYPTNASFVAGVMDIQNVNVQESTNLDMTFTMGAVSDAWGPTNGFDHTSFTIFINDPNKTGGTALPGINGTMPSGNWDYEIFVDGWGKNLYAYGAPADSNDYVNGLTKSAASSDIAVTVDKTAKTIKISVPKTDLGNAANLTGWQVYATTFDGDGATTGRKYRDSGAAAGEYSLGNVTSTTPKIVTSALASVGSSAVQEPKAGDFGKIRLDSNNNVTAFEKQLPLPSYVDKDNFASLLADDAAVFNENSFSGTDTLNVYNGKAFKAGFTALKNPANVIYGDADATTGFAPIKVVFFSGTSDLKGATSSTYVIIPDITTAVQVATDKWTVKDSAGNTINLSNTEHSALSGDGFNNNYRVINGLSYDTTDTSKVVSATDLTAKVTAAEATDGLAEKTVLAADPAKFSFDLSQSPILYADSPTIFVVGADLKPVVKTTADITKNMDVKYHKNSDGKVDLAVAAKIVSNVTFKVTAPASTNGEALYLVGDFSNWNASDFWTSDFSKYASAYKMTNPVKNADGTYTYTLSGVNNLIVGSKYQVVRDNSLTADKWHSLAGNADKSEIKDNYVIVDANDSNTVNLTVAAWRDR